MALPALKILHVNEHLSRKGGVETYLLELMPMLESQGIANHLIFGSGDPLLWPTSTATPAVGKADFRADRAGRRRVAQLVQQEAPDLIHVHNVQNVGVLQACLEYGPTVMTTHDYRAVCPANTFFLKRTREVCHRDGAGLGCFATSARKKCVSLRPRYGAYFYRRARWTTAQGGRFSRVIAPSAGARDRMIQAGFRSEQVDVLPYFCPIEPATEPRPLPERPTITYMGRIAPNKGHESFIQALGLLSAEVQGIMVGNFRDGSRDSLRALAMRHGCGDRLTFRGWASRNEVVRVLDETTVFVFPSTWPETLGIVGLEALARGVPVVASDIGGVREWLEDGRNGYLVPPKNPQAISEAVRRILDAGPDSLGHRGIESINERFLPGTHVDRLIDIYEQVVGGGRSEGVTRAVSNGAFD